MKGHGYVYHCLLFQLEVLSVRTKTHSAFSISNMIKFHLNLIPNSLNCISYLQTHTRDMFTFNEEDLVSMAKDCQPFFHTPHLMHSSSYKTHNGHRILCLDGGWMRSLIQIDILEQLELFTGQSITEMFDVLVGSSSGALIILAIVYGKLDW